MAKVGYGAQDGEKLARGGEDGAGQWPKHCHRLEDEHLVEQSNKSLKYYFMLLVVSFLCCCFVGVGVGGGGYATLSMFKLLLKLFLKNVSIFSALSGSVNLLHNSTERNLDILNQKFHCFLCFIYR